ncbi:MAG: APC family permease [Euzebyales bacterium]|nr:APC family permease [Euzebyales bacterium]MBA3620984.1 APC family permease [Euzebyales bacterium]
MTDLSTVKRVLIGRPRATRELKHQLLPKWMALPVFSSDPLSSVAYATEEMMLVLALAGAAAFSLVLPLAFAVATLLTIVIISYRQTVRAYPRGGGAYIVSRTNLGDIPGLTAASALLIDYTLTVSVSIAAGVAAITSAVPALDPYRLYMALGFVVAVTLANLRGVKEAGALFALPTYTFVATMFVLIGSGLVQCIGGCPAAPPSGQIEAETGLGLFLILRAFSSGSTALTGVEAISDGVLAFRYPQSRNAATTLGVMGIMAVSMFLGISFLATHVENVVAFEGMERTVNAQIALAVFGDGPGFFMVQFVTAAILILAANTAYADFPRLSWFLARDRYLPRQFLARGDRLGFSNGILVLATLASLLLVAFDAEVSRLIQLYVVGVFTSFTLSQSGMVRHWLRTRGPGWQRSAIVNGIGAATTGVVLVIVSITKFTRGAWIVIVAIPIVVVMMYRIHRHYRQVSLELRAGVAETDAPRPIRMVVLLDRVDEALARALSYVRAVGPQSIRAYAVPQPNTDVEADWAGIAPDIPLEALVPANSRQADDAVTRALTSERERHPNAFTTAIVPETLSESMFEVVRRHRLALRIKSGLVGKGIVVANVVAPRGDPPFVVEEPIEHHVVVLVSAVHKATVRALAYAEGLGGTTLRALSINLETEKGNALLDEWDDWGVDVPLELLDSPFRSLSESVRTYVREFRPDGRHTVVTCVVPEFVLPRLIHRPLHNQTALIIKGALLFEPGVVVTSVPYGLSTGLRAEETAEQVGAGGDGTRP